MAAAVGPPPQPVRPPPDGKAPTMAPMSPPPKTAMSGPPAPKKGAGREAKQLTWKESEWPS